GPMTRRAILRAWPDSAAAPAALTLWKWLGRAVRQGGVLQQGKGTSKDPYLYSLPGLVGVWQGGFVGNFLRRPAAPQGEGPPWGPVRRRGREMGTVWLSRTLPHHGERSRAGAGERCASSGKRGRSEYSKIGTRCGRTIHSGRQQCRTDARKIKAPLALR